MSTPELELIFMRGGDTKLTMKMNLEQFEIFIKELPNMEQLYQNLVADLLKNTAANEKEIKVLIASQLLKTLNSAMPIAKEKTK